jgi:hypothetical protein
MWAIRPRLIVTSRIRWVDNLRNLIAGCSAWFAGRNAAGIGLGIALVEKHYSSLNLMYSAFVYI